MKFRFVIAFSLLLALSFTNISTAQDSFTGDSWEKVRANKNGTLILTYVETPAFVYRDANDKLQGICIDIINSFTTYIKNSYGVNLNVEFKGDGKSFRDFYTSVQNSKGGVIGLGNVTIKEERKKEVAFTPAYIKSIALLVTHNDSPDINNLTEIASKWTDFVAYVPKGTTHEIRMNNLKETYYPDLEIKYATSSFEALDKILEEKNAICFQDIALYWDYKQKGKPIKSIRLNTNTGEELAMILPKDSDWVPVFNEFFAVGSGFKSSPIYRRSLMKHLGSEVVQMLRMAQ